MNPESHERLESGIQVPLTMILDSIPRPVSWITLNDVIYWSCINAIQYVLSRILISVGVQTQSKLGTSFL